MSGRDWASGGVGGLVEAVRKGHPRHVQLLLEAGAPVDDQDDTGTTAMVAAILTPQEDRLREKLMKLLLQAGANPNIGDSRGTTPLMHAAISNVVPAVVFLLQQDIVDLSLQDGDGNSALMYAAAFGHREIVLLILAAFKKLHHVAVQGQRNGQGLTAWQLAEKNGHEDIAALLKVESQTFGRPAGPSCFIPANPLDLDRPPTPTETPSPTVRSSSKRLKNTGRSNTAPEPKDPIAPLQPALQNNPSRGPTFSTDLRRRRIFKEETVKEVQSIEPRKTKSEEGPDPSGGISSISSGKLRASEVGLEDRIGGVSLKKQETEARPKEVEKLTNSASVVVRGAVEKVSEEESKGKNLVSKGLSVARCRASRLAAVSRSNGPLADLQKKWCSRESSRDQEITDAVEKTAETNSSGSVNSSSSSNSSKETPTPAPLSKSSRNEASTRSSDKTSIDQLDRTLTNTESLLVCAPDSTERKVLEELMREFTLAGSPGSGNEADTESLMECEGSPRESFAITTSSSNITSTTNKMSVPNSSRKMTLTNVPLAVAALTSPNESMPKIDLSSSTRSLNRSIQHLVQEDTENKPGHRPPTPARPSLPTLLPGRLLDTSLNASMASTKSEGRYAPPSRRVTFSSFPRSSSEPRSLTASPRPHQNPENDYDSDSDEHSSDLLDSSTRSEGWDHLRGARGRGPAYANASEGHVVTLPPINQSKYLESGGRGRDGARSRGGAMTTHGENVLSVAKKTLEQLETVLAPSEGPSLSRAIPRTRATHQIHLET